MALFQLVMGFV